MNREGLHEDIIFRSVSERAVGETKKNLEGLSQQGPWNLVAEMVLVLRYRESVWLPIGL